MNKFKITIFFIIGLNLIGFGEEINFDKAIPPYPPLKEIKDLAGASQFVAILKISEIGVTKEFVVDVIIKGEVAENHFYVYTLEVNSLMPADAFFVYFFGVSQDDDAKTVSNLLAITGDKIEVVGGERILFKGYEKKEIIRIISK